MRLTLKKSMAFLIGIGALLLLLVGWRLGSPVYLALGVATLVVLSIFANVVVYRHVVHLLDRIAHLDQRVGASVSMAQQSAGADKRQAKVSEELVASQHRFQHDLTGFSSRLDGMAKRLDASEGALRVAARQSGDAIDVTLRVFQEMAARHEEISRHGADLAGRMGALDAGLQSLLAMPDQINLATEGVVSSAMDEPNRKLHQLLGQVESTRSELAPFVDLAGKQLRQLIRTQQSQQDGLAPFVDATGRQ